MTHSIITFTFAWKRRYSCIVDIAVVAADVAAAAAVTATEACAYACRMFTKSFECLFLVAAHVVLKSIE